MANWGQQSCSTMISCLPTYVPGFAPHLSPTLLVLSSHPSTFYIFSCAKQKKTNDDGNVVWWMVLIRATLLSWASLNLSWMLSFQACSLSGSWWCCSLERGGLCWAGWWLDRSGLLLAGKQESHRSREGQVGSETVLSVVDEQDRNFFNPAVRLLKRVVSPDSVGSLFEKSDFSIKNVKFG